MIRLDSTKITLPTQSILSLSDRFQRSTKVEQGVIISDKSDFKTKDIIGLKSISIDNLNHTAVVEFSAKILGSDYIEGVNKNTIQMVVENINTSKIVKFDTNCFLDTAEILRCDVTDNIKTDLSNDMLFKTLSALPIAKKYHVDYYNTKSNSGVVYKGNQKTIRERIIFYDKTKDILRSKDLRALPYAQKLFNDFNGVARVESNHSDFKTLRKLFGTRNLCEALESPTKVNYDVFSRITDKTNDFNLSLFNQFEGMKFHQIRSYLGDKGIIDMCSNDWAQIENFIRRFNPSNYRHYKKQIRLVYNSLNQETKVIDLTLINHIKQLLHEVA